MTKFNNKTNEQLQSNGLTFFQQLAVEGEVAAIMQGCTNDMEKMYYAFLKLALCEERYLLVYKDEFIKYLDESQVNDIVGYRYSEIVPTYLFVYKFLSEIKGMMGESCGNLRISRQPLSVVKSKFVVALREMLTYVPATATAILDGIVREAGDELDFLVPIVFALKETAEVDVMEQRVGYDVKIKLLSQPLDRAPIMNIQIEEERVQQAIRTEGMTKEERVQSHINELTSALTSVVNAMIGAPNEDVEVDDDTIDESDKEEKLVYLVKKIDKSNNQVVFTKEFETQKQATEYIKDIVEKYPEIINRFNFSVELAEK